MKIIELLNKIANGEEVPKVYYCDNELYIGDDGFLKDRYGFNVEWWIDKKWLNKEVEIIEEKKIPEKLNYPHIEIESSADDEIRDYLYKVKDKFDEIIDYLKSKGE